MSGRYAVWVITPQGYPHSQAFHEVALTLDQGLKQLGHDSVITTAPPGEGRRAIVLGSNLLPSHPQPLPPDAILYNLEQVQTGSAWIKPQLLELFRQHPVWDYSQQNIEGLKTRGITNVVHVPIGYVPQLSRIPSAPEVIDVLFYGSINDRRRKILDSLKAKGLTLEAHFGLYGAVRDQLIAHSKVILNLHYFEAKVFEIVRVSYLLANRKAVVSERGSDAQEEQPFESAVAFADYDRIVDRCVELVANAGQRRELAERGFAVMSARNEADILARALGTS